MKNAKQTILIIDDEPLNLRMLCSILSENYDVRMAKSGIIGIEVACKYKVDLILLDIVMEEMHGYDVISVLKSKPETSHIPVIFITSLSDICEEERGLSLGAVDYITKPFSETIVKLRVSVHLKIVEQLNLIKRISLTDSLTGLDNRASFQDRINLEWQYSMLNKSYLGILLCDIDRFKSINDKFGHAGGDVILREFGSLLRNSVRECDFVARWGGEEFIILLPKTNMANSYLISDFIRKKVENSSVILVDTVATFTVSFGCISLIPSNKDTIDSVFIKLDKALYKAKENGRNRVEVANGYY